MSEDTEQKASPWVPQEDGTHLPSEELLDRVRDGGKEQFPTAVADFAQISGKSEDEVRDILNNPRDRGLFWAPTAIAGDLLQGVTQGAAVAMEKVGEMSGDEEEGDALASDIQGVSDWMDPSFDSEKSTGEVITEGLGQAIPAVAATFATGGVATGVIAGAAAATMTFEDEDNLVQMVDDLTGGAMPDVMVIDDEDDMWTRRAKAGAANLIADLALMGAGKGVAKVYRALKSRNAKAIDEAVTAAAEEAGLPVPQIADDVAVSNPDALTAVEDIAKKAATETDDAARVSDDAIQSGAADLNESATSGTAKAVPFEEDIKAFRTEALSVVDSTLKRSMATNPTRKNVLQEFIHDADGRSAMLKQTEDVFKALQDGNFDNAYDLINNFRSAKHADYDPMWQGAVLKASLTRMEARMDDIIKRIRADPKLQTVKAWNDLSEDIFEAKIKMAEKYREVGTGQSYGLLGRKGELDAKAIKAINDADEELSKTMTYGLKATKVEFMAANMNRMSAMGLNPTRTLDQLYKMFDEFDAKRQGILANMKSSTLAKLSKAERETLENSWLRMIHDLHSSALLGQPSTAGLEVMSNTINNITLPITQNILGAKSFRDVPLGIWRAQREYAGYAAGWSKSYEVFKAAYKKGKSITDDFDILDGAQAGKIDYEKLADEGKWVRYMLVRLWKFAADVSIAASESQKAWRGFGTAYADGYELAAKSGIAKADIPKKAREYAEGTFNDKLAFTDLLTRLDVQESSWQSAFDTRYGTGKLAQWIDNFRNSSNPIVAIPARATIPFFRTLVNIGGHSAQFTVPPGLPGAIRLMGKTKFGQKHAFKSAKFLDDFSGNNGTAAQTRAQGRQRMGMAMIGGAMALTEMGAIEITGPGGYQSWDAKMEKWNTKPGSAIIIGDTVVDLTRFLPFSAPLLMVGMLREQIHDDKLKMSNGEYPQAEGGTSLMASYLPSLGLLWYSMLSDAGAMRGVGELFENVQKAAEEQSPMPLAKMGESYLKQFMPGAPRAIMKNKAFVTGEEDDWDQYRGEGFLQEVMASAGWATGYKRLDFLGKPIRDKGRGLDPTNWKGTKVNSDALYAEYANLNHDADLAITIPSPERVYDKAYWKRFGRTPGSLDWFVGAETPSLTKLKTKSGDNAYDRYRELVYTGRAAKDISKSTSGSGDRISIGSVVVEEGETFETAIRRYTSSDIYQDMTQDARKKVWKSVFTVFSTNAKKQLGTELVVDPSVFKDSKYGEFTSEPTTLKETEGLAKSRIKGIQLNKGLPNSLDTIFAID